MKITVIALGQRLDPWVNQGFKEYQKRMPASWQINLIEIPLTKRTKTQNTAHILTQEGNVMLQAIPKYDVVIALAIDGNAYDSSQLAQQLLQFANNGQHISILIGGPEGLALQCQQRASYRWSLSPLTLPHPLARLVLVEALYRSYSIITKHPYHK